MYLVGKGKKATSKDGAKQSTLFGLPPPADEATKKSNKGKKRKSAANETIEEETQDTQGSLASFLAKDRVLTATPALESTQVEDETQPVTAEEEEQISKRQRISTPEEDDSLPPPLGETMEA